MNQINLPGNRHKTRNKASMWTAPRKTCTYQGQLYMTMHVREENSDRLFEVENADSPPSLSKHDVLRSGLKSDLLSYLEVDCPSDFDEAGAKLIAGAHIVHYFRRQLLCFPRSSAFLLCEKLLGDWVRDIGWVEMFIDADVTSPGRADALVKGAHVTRTRYAHQATALWLSIILRKDAYTRYTVVCEENGAELISFKTWCILHHCPNANPFLIDWLRPKPRATE